MTRADSVMNKVNRNIIEREKKLHMSIQNFMNRYIYSQRIKTCIDNDYLRRLLKALIKINPKAVSCYEITEIDIVKSIISTSIK